MASVQSKNHSSSAELLEAAERLNAVEFDRFVSDVVTLRAQRQAPRLGLTESQLLKTINQGLPEDRQVRFNQLIEQRQAEALTAEEMDELVSLTNQAEQLDDARFEAVTQLAALRKVSVEVLLKSLGLPSANHAG